MGWLGDRWSKSQLSALGILVCVGGFLLLLRSSSPLALYSFPLTMAVALGTAPLNWSLVGDFYGRGSYGTLRGIMRMANGAGAFLAPVYAGWTFDHTGSYGEVLLVFAVVLLVSAFLFFLLAPPSQPRRS
jgi:MFS family permease